MNKDNLIVIKGGSHSDIKKALQQWIELYSDDLETDIKFEFYKTGQESHLIVADKRLNNEKFNFLVNYLRYPENIEYKISIEGYTTAKKENLYPEDILNKRLLIYISENDKEFDNVLVTTEDNETYKVDFGGKITRSFESKTFKIPDFDFESLSRPEKITLNKTKIEEKRKENSKADLEKRFKTISFIVLGIMVISSLTLFFVNYIFFKITFWLGIGLGTWFFGEYKMLQINKYYNYSFLIALAFLCFGVFIKYIFPSLSVEILDLGSLIPISVLVVQKPLRLIYKLTLNREPVVDTPPPTFWDWVYTIILFLSLAALPMTIMNQIK